MVYKTLKSIITGYHRILFLIIYFLQLNVNVI